jgi:membrane protease YdiL (CAAX protease family)
MVRNPRQEASRQASRARSTRRLTLWVETSVVLLLIAGPLLARIPCWLFWGGEYLQYDEQFFQFEVQTSATFGINRFESMISQLMLIPIVLFIIWRSGDTWSRFGLVKPKWRKDILIGLGLFLIVAVVSNESLGALFHESFRFTLWNLLPASSPPWRTVLLIASACAIGFSEELTSRAYLIPRLEELIGATWKCVLLSSMIFVVLHLSKGIPGVVNSFLCGAIWGISFCLTRRIWPAAISHALNDFVCTSHINSLIGS